MANTGKIESPPKSPTQIRTPLRRTERKSLPNSALMIRRQIIQKNLKTPDSMKRRQKNVKIKKNIDRKLKVQKRIKFENNNTDDVESMQKPALNACDSSPKTDVKHESDDDERLDLPENFIVTKATGITPDITRDIQPTYFPSEDENSGVIVFKSNSRRAVLNISFAKCFVILNGTFSIDEQGHFSNGDFIKAPAGSKLGIKYLGGSDGCGKIIFFKSVS